MTLKTQIIPSYHTPAPGATPILLHPKLVETISLQTAEEWYLFQSKAIINKSALADVLRELPCRICETLFLKLPCCMKRVRKSIRALMYYL